MNREYYIYWYQFENKTRYLIWFTTDNKDGFLIDRKGFVPSFKNLENVQQFTSELQINVDIDNPNFFDLDKVLCWVNQSSEEIEDYNSILDAWNLFEDISVSTNGDFDLDKDLTCNIYERIFWGCNIPAMTPEGKSFTPTWTKKEMKIIRETLNQGFQLFKEKINIYEMS